MSQLSFKMLFLIVILLSPLLIQPSLQKPYFCDLKCIMGGKHTVCKYEPCLPHGYCGPGYKMLQLNDEERTFMTAAHNKLRQRVASGGDTQGGNGKAANMKAFSYSKELEFVAQCWANRCNQLGAHDECRAIKGFPAVGQNMYMRTLSSGETSNTDLERAVQAWYDEIKLTNAGVINSFHSGGGYGHFTQVVWAKTEYVGCGRTRYGKRDALNLLIICNYATAGNFLGQSVYKFGEACTDCGGASCNSEYGALCGKIRPVKEDKWEPPFAMGASSLETSIVVIATFIISVLYI